MYEENPAKKLQPNEEVNLDPFVENIMEEGNVPTPISTPPPETWETLLEQEPNGPPPGGVSGNASEQDPSLQMENLSLRRKRLSGAARKRLSRLIKAGTPYEDALKLVQEQCEVNRQGGTIPPSQATKRHLSDTSTPERDVKRHCGVEAEARPTLTYGAAAGGVRVGIIHADYPTVRLTAEEMGLVKRAILQEFDTIPDGSPLVAFHALVHRPGWLLATCTDEVSAQWIDYTVATIEPWKGARLRTVQGKDLPKPHVCVAYIPDDEDGKRLSSEVVLGRLRRSNDLRTQEWVILRQEDAGKGQTWTFSIDEGSLERLKVLNMKPLFAFGGPVHFRLKGAPQPTTSEKPDQRSGGLPKQAWVKPTAKAGTSGLSKSGKGAPKGGRVKSPAEGAPGPSRQQPTTTAVATSTTGTVPRDTGRAKPTAPGTTQGTPERKSKAEKTETPSRRGRKEPTLRGKAPFRPYNRPWKGNFERTWKPQTSEEARNWKGKAPQPPRKLRPPAYWLKKPEAGGGDEGGEGSKDEETEAGPSRIPTPPPKDQCPPKGQ